ncbi:MAG: type II secretion system protein [Proteobacteria bacterium]|nr:type II secretion system protein [Pseudomonadota bacterium]
MIVTAIIGILAAVAVPAFMNYSTRTKTSEAVLNIRVISEGAIVYFEAEQSGGRSHFLPLNKIRTPKDVSKGVKNKIDSIILVSFKADPTWIGLNFTPNDDFYYSYSFASDCQGVLCLDDKTATISAFGDLDGDGVISTFSTTMTVIESQLTTGHLTKTNELE